MDKYRVGVLGSTGLVGQVFTSILARHPWFELETLAASPGKAGLKYGEAVEWVLGGDPPENAVERKLVRPVPEDFPRDLDLVFSALPRSVAEKLEPVFLEEGFLLVSNSSNMRLEPDIPLIVPEVNPDHLSLIGLQRAGRRWRRGLVKNPNCSTAILVLALKPLLDSYRIRRVFVTTLQALSGAGYSGVPSMAIQDNVLPVIQGEEAKLSSEPLKILGELEDRGVKPAGIKIHATTTRIPVSHGHLESVFLEIPEDPGMEELAERLEAFRSLPQDLGLPTAPDKPVIVRMEDDRPQPRLDREAGGGMSVSVGRIKRLGEGWYRMLVLGHNLVRGAAGNAVLIAELMISLGLL